MGRRQMSINRGERKKRGRNRKRRVGEKKENERQKLVILEKAFELSAINEEPIPQEVYKSVGLNTTDEQQKIQQETLGWAAITDSGYLSPLTFNRLRGMDDKDVTIKVLYCGICPSDLRSIKYPDPNSACSYPRIPGHEIVGEVTEVGKTVRKFKVGDKVGVGCMIGPLHSCADKGCRTDPWDCAKNIVRTYYHGAPSIVYGGGLSDTMVVKERFVVRLPENLPLEKVAPLLCAGINVYRALQFYGLNKPGIHLGVVELCGANGHLYHLAVKFAKAFGVNVTMISKSPAREMEAIENLGADSFLLLGTDKQTAAKDTMDAIINTLPFTHARTYLKQLLKPNGKMIQVGERSNPEDLLQLNLTMEKTQEMIDFAAEHNITADVELIPMKDVNRAMIRLDRADVKYCFVIDVAKTLARSTAEVPRFEIMKLKAVAFWSWDMRNEQCLVCGNELTDICLECEAREQTTRVEECPLTRAVCNHAYHFHCIRLWVSEHEVCPVDGIEFPEP